MRRIPLCLGLIGMATTMPLLAATHKPTTNQFTNPINYKPSVTTGSTDQAIDMAVDAGNGFLHNIFNSTNRPDWLTRTSINYAVQHRSLPLGDVETTQPLFESRWSTLFWQGRISYYDETGTGNIGLGYRYLTDDRSMMWGINTFYDAAFRFGHRRLGFGGELFTRFLTFRLNIYDAISHIERTGTSAYGVSTYERALSGYDASIETPVPYISWMRLSAQGYRWIGVTASDLNGGEALLRIFPSRQVELDAGAAFDNQNGTQTFLKLSYYIGSPAFIENSATTPSYHGAFAPLDLEKQRLQKIIRHNDIVVEKTNNSISGSGIIVARGT